MATGVAARLARAGFPLVMTELPEPLVVRRTVALASAVREERARVEDLEAIHVHSVDQVAPLLDRGAIPLLVDPQGASIRALAPMVVVDARMAKRNLGTDRSDAPLVIGLGPGFTAGQDVHAVVETNRGHALGRVIWAGSAEPNTGTPGIVAGRGAERVLRAPAAGRVVARQEIGALVAEGDLIATIHPATGAPLPVVAPFHGVLRGLIADGTMVPSGFKIGDLDPRATPEHCLTISDKALAIGGGVLEAVLLWLRREARR